MGKVLFPAYYPCGEFISFGGIVYTPLNLDNLRSEMAVYLRVKKWKATVIVTPQGESPNTFIQYGYWDANTEEDLCCHNSTYFLNDPPYFGSWPASTFLFAFTNQKPYLVFFYSDSDEGRAQKVTSIYTEGYNEEVLTIDNFNFTPTISIPKYSSTNTEISSMSVSIRAEEYWSYGGTYDTVTGEPL
jgi:hypothetical protein